MIENSPYKTYCFSSSLKSSKLLFFFSFSPFFSGYKEYDKLQLKTKIEQDLWFDSDKNLLGLQNGNF